MRFSWPSKPSSHSTSALTSTSRKSNLAVVWDQMASPLEINHFENSNSLRRPQLCPSANPWSCPESLQLPLAKANRESHQIRRWWSLNREAKPPTMKNPSRSNTTSWIIINKPRAMNRKFLGNQIKNLQAGTWWIAPPSKRLTRIAVLILLQTSLNSKRSRGRSRTTLCSRWVSNQTTLRILGRHSNQAQSARMIATAWRDTKKFS